MVQQIRDRQPAAEHERRAKLIQSVGWLCGVAASLRIGNNDRDRYSFSSTTVATETKSNILASGY